MGRNHLWLVVLTSILQITFTNGFLQHWFHPNPAVDVEIDSGVPVLQPNDPATEALLLTQQAVINITDCGPPLGNTNPTANQVVAYIQTAINIIFDVTQLSHQPITSVGIVSSGPDGTCQIVYQIDMAIYLVFHSSKDAGSAKYDFQDHARFGLAFKSIFTLAVHGAMLGRTVDVNGPPLAIEYVQGPVGQPVLGQPFASENQPFEGGPNFNPILGRSPGKSGKSGKSGSYRNFGAAVSVGKSGKGHKQGKLTWLQNTQTKTKSSQGSHIVVVGGMMYVCVAAMVALVGFKAWKGSSSYEQLEDSGSSKSPVLTWMMKEHARLESNKPPTATALASEQQPRIMPMSEASEVRPLTEYRGYQEI